MQIRNPVKGNKIQLFRYDPKRFPSAPFSGMVASFNKNIGSFHGVPENVKTILSPDEVEQLTKYFEEEKRRGDAEYAELNARRLAFNMRIGVEALTQNSELALFEPESMWTSIIALEKLLKKAGFPRPKRTYKTSVQ